MQGKFFWITDTYRVNINSIFSLEDKQIDNSEEHKKWYIEYEKCLDEIKQDEEILKTIVDRYKDETQSVIENAINQYICDKIGTCPDSVIHNYWIILMNGMKIQVSEFKYEEINNMIDKYCT